MTAVVDAAGRENHALADEELVVVAALVDAVVEIGEDERFGNGLDPRRGLDRAGLDVGPADPRAALTARGLRGADRHAANPLDVDLGARPAADEHDTGSAPAGSRRARDIHFVGLAVELAAIEGRLQILAEGAVIA